MKNHFQTRAFALARELAKAIQLSPSPLDTGNGIEYKNYLSHTIFTIYDNRLDKSNKAGVELAIGDHNIFEEYGIEQSRTIKWVEACVAIFAHHAESKAPQNWIRLAFHKESEFQKFSSEFINFLQTTVEKNTKAPPRAEPPKKRELDERVMREIWARRGQVKFRSDLISAYHNTCAVTGCTETEVLEAAHIIPYKDEQTYSINNGILLRADIHTLFDLLLLSINPQSGTVVVSEKLSEEYLQYQGRKAHLPPDYTELPDHAALMAHSKRVTQ